MSALLALAESARLAAAVTPDGLAVVDGSLRWTWQKLDERAGEVALGLRIQGVRPGDRVALLASPCAGAIAALHGIARIGAVAAPIGTALTTSELARTATVLDPILVIHDGGHADAAADLGHPMVALEDLVDAEGGPRPEAAPGGAVSASPTVDLAAPAVDPSAPAVAILTSGTTGHPRAALLSTAALVASAESWLAAIPPATGWLLAMGLGHVAGLGVVWRAALTGVPLIILARADPAAMVAALSTEPTPSHVSLVPTTLGRILDLVADDPPPASLRAVLVGGGPIPPDLVTRAVRAGWPVVPTYGLTEAGSGVTALPTADALRYPASAGPALPGVQLRIDRPDEEGIGGIQVLTPARYSGYLGDPTVTTTTTLTEDGWLATGDLGRLDDGGRLFVSDRRMDRIVRGGENFSPAEVETVLRLHPAIADVAVVGRRDLTWGQVPVAAIVLRPDAPDPGDDAFRQHCHDRIASFKVPAAFVRLAELPRTAGGKVRRVELRERLDPGAGAAAHLRHLDRPDGVRLAYRRQGGGPVALALLHGTLSTAGQLSGLARALAGSGQCTVLSMDRRGSGGSRLAIPSAVDMAAHVADIDAVLDAEGHAAAIMVGVSFGGVVALEAAARVPGRVLAVVAYEPPYGPVADADTQRAFAIVAAATERAYRSGGAPAAAEAFMRGVAGVGAWDRLPERTRAFLEGEGDGAFVDAGLTGLDPAGLARIRVPVTLLTGDASEPFYRPITDALLRRIPGSRHVSLPGLAHASPITDPAPVAEAIRSALADAGLFTARPMEPTE